MGSGAAGISGGAGPFLMMDKEMDRMNNEAPRTYEEVLSYIESIPKFTTKNTLEVTRAYLRILGSPEEGLRVIHVAGTNGKGSVSAYLSKILQKASVSNSFTSKGVTMMS